MYLPYQAEVILIGPQFIEEGTIKLNNQEIHNGFIQYNSLSLVTLCEKEFLNEDIREIDLSSIKCSSAHVLNSLIEQLG